MKRQATLERATPADLPAAMAVIQELSLDLARARGEKLDGMSVESLQNLMANQLAAAEKTKAMLATKSAERKKEVMKTMRL